MTPLCNASLATINSSLAWINRSLLVRAWCVPAPQCNCHLSSSLHVCHPGFQIWIFTFYTAQIIWVTSSSKVTWGKFGGWTTTACISWLELGFVRSFDGESLITELDWDDLSIFVVGVPMNLHFPMLLGGFASQFFLHPSSCIFTWVITRCLERRGVAQSNPAMAGASWNRMTYYQRKVVHPGFDGATGKPKKLLIHYLLTTDFLGSSFNHLLVQLIPKNPWINLDIHMGRVSTPRTWGIDFAVSSANKCIEAQPRIEWIHWQLGVSMPTKTSITRWWNLKICLS